MSETDPSKPISFSDSMMLNNYLVLRLMPEKADAVIAAVQQFWMDEFDRFLPPEMVRTALASWFEREANTICDGAQERLLDASSEDATFFQTLIENLQKRQIELEAARFQTATAPLGSPKSRNAGTANTSNKSLPEKNIFNGFRVFSAKRFSAMIAYIASHGRQMYKTKINKLLFYSDFVNFYRNGRSISGTLYIHLPFGPVPDQYEPILKQLVESRHLKIYSVRAPNSAAGEIIHRDTNAENLEKLLAADEVDTIDWVLANYGRMSTKAIVDLSHREKAYRSTRQNEAIAYGYAKFLKKLPPKN